MHRAYDMTSVSMLSVVSTLSVTMSTVSMLSVAVYMSAVSMLSVTMFMVAVRMEC